MRTVNWPPATKQNAENKEFLTEGIDNHDRQNID